MGYSQITQGRRNQTSIKQHNNIPHFSLSYLSGFFGLLWISSVILTDISSITLRSPSQAVAASSEPSDFPPVHCFSFSSLEFPLPFYYLLTKYHEVLFLFLEADCVLISLVLTKYCHQMFLLIFLFSPRLTWTPQIQGTDAQGKACQY